MAVLRIDYAHAATLYFDTHHSVIGRGLKRRGYQLRPVGLHSGEGNQNKGANSNLYRHGKPYPRKAKWTMENALRRGDIIRPDYCEKCNIKCTPDGHHDDYRKPLVIRWLCRHCHNEWHRHNIAKR